MKKISDTEIIETIKGALQMKSESTKVEFKDARGGLPGTTWKTISSFSHQPGGGYIVFGIKEDREKNKIEVVGDLDLAQLQEHISSLMKNEMVNCGAAEFRIIEFNNTQLLILIINETPGELKPCYKLQLGLPNGACIRDGNTDRTITDLEMRSFIRNSSFYKFDKSEALGTDIDFLSLDKVQSFLEKNAQRVGRIDANNQPTVDIMKNLDIVKVYEDGVRPTVGGFLIFSKNNPQLFNVFSRYVIRCVRYQGTTVATPILDKRDIFGTLDQQIDDMEKFILRNIARKAEIKGTQRVEMYEYPEDAIRELVANAVIHRDYMITETYTHINIFSNRIEISNPGNLPPGVTIDNIKDSQFSRNEVIAKILSDMNYLEEYGRGIDIVFSKMSEWGLMEPVFKNTSNSFKVILLGESFKDLNDRQLSIWYYLTDHKFITSSQCRDMFPSVSRATISNDLKGLVRIGLIFTKGAGTNITYEACY